MIKRLTIEITELRQQVAHLQHLSEQTNFRTMMMGLEKTNSKLKIKLNEANKRIFDLEFQIRERDSIILSVGKVNYVQSKHQNL